MSGTALKYIMLFLMVLDHIPYFVPYEVWLVFHLISRCVAVFFAYMAVEGFVYTKSRPKYICRLFFWAALMFLGNFILNIIVINQEKYLIQNNIFFTLALGVTVLYLLQKLLESKDTIQRSAIAIAVLGLIFTALLFAEGGIVIIPFMLISYNFRERKRLRNTLYCLLSALVFLLIFPVADWGSTELVDVLEKSDFLFISFLPFAYIYNGRRGKSTKFNKYVFYIFYPLHIWLITLTAWYFKF